MKRKIKRNILKNKLKSHNIGPTWQKLQKKLYGDKNWLYKMFFPCGGSTTNLYQYK